MFRSSINSSLGTDVSGPLGDMARQAREEAMKALSLGFGIYLSALVSLYLAGVGAKKFLVARAIESVPASQPKGAAA